ncbi:MAG: SpoIIE family protein phosphatase [Leptospiraceae bacterium]|nr:SpoIIE family protein phosphatase [Leptospiraceae bacterium]
MFFRILLIVLLFFQCKNTDKNKLSFLNGEWKYRIGFDIDWLSNPGKESEWKKISLPTNITKQLELNSYTGHITLRRELPDSMNSYLKNGKPLAINAGRVLDVSYFYLNKTLIGQLGSSSPYQSGAMRPFLKDIPFNDISENDKNTLTIVLYTNGKYPLQFMDNIEIGESDSVYTSYTKKEIYSFFFLTVYLVVGLYHILLANKRRKDLYNLYFGLFCLFASIYWFIANTLSRDAVFQDSVELHRKLEHAFMFTMSATLLLFLVQFFEKKYSQITKGLTIFCVTLIVFTILLPLPVMRFCSILWQTSNLFIGPYMIYYLIRQIKLGNKDGLYLIVGLCIFVTGGLLDMATSRGYIHLPQLSNFTFLIFVMGIATIMANRFMFITNEVEILNAELEKKVEDRTKKLSESLEQVNTLKEQQDGDYYLTSLLVQPLSGNFIKLKETEFKIETLIRQKKQFHFKNKNSEIGGDICIADEINLQGLTYTVFLNGDAMGKSIQGAGGCLVLGTVFKSILERNHSLTHTRSIPPELWMKESFRELQNVFVSFNGSMLISAMFGIIDNRNGTIYYINAEHPYTALYRDGHANFIDSDSQGRKIGIELKHNPLKINIFQLKPADSLIAGSDGRDDLLLGEDESGARIINENENLFLKILEEANGDLPKVEEILHSKGEITDDLSLLKITYNKKKEPATILSKEEIEAKLKEAYNYYQKGDKTVAIVKYEKLFAVANDAELAQEIANIFIEKKDYSFSSQILDTCIAENPSNSNLFYLSSFIKKRNREYKDAAILGERFRLREPNNVKNLVNLADIYRYLNKFEKSQKFLNRALHLEPDNKHALKLKENLADNNFS